MIRKYKVEPDSHSVIKVILTRESREGDVFSARKRAILTTHDGKLDLVAILESSFCHYLEPSSSVSCEPVTL